VLAEELRHLHFLREKIRADPVERIVLGHLAAGWQLPALRRDRFELRAEADLGV
jgi:hypothetical protein